MEFYNKHYIQIDTKGKILRGFSDAFWRPQEGDICINEQGGYQFRIFPGGEENPPITNMQGCHIWRYENGQVRASTAEELAAEEAELEVATAKVTQISTLKAQLEATDYMAIKYAEGWITADEYEATKAQRQAWRDEINILEGPGDANY